MVAAAVAGDFDRAMREGWQAFVLSSGDRDREAEVLTNMAQVLHESGRHDAALRGFAAAVTRTGRSDRTPSSAGWRRVGGRAPSGVGTVVQAAASRVERLAGSAWAYPLCSAFLDLADAYFSSAGPSGGDGLPPSCAGHRSRESVSRAHPARR